MTTVLKGSEFVTLTGQSTAGTQRVSGAPQTAGTTNIIGRRNLRRDRRAVRAI
ncbi:hypothetical protein ACJ3XI_06540 [Litorimonas sp. RW-G-Af-16]|uniref:hypothetical protein n=1 Tax=Litorimonas sp. RW-G-Af-16 TaxID=3241168 RepID=UPI00390C75E3